MEMVHFEGEFDHLYPHEGRMVHEDGTVWEGRFMVGDKWEEKKKKKVKKDKPKKGKSKKEGSEEGELESGESEDEESEDEDVSEEESEKY